MPRYTLAPSEDEETPGGSDHSLKISTGRSPKMQPYSNFSGVSPEARVMTVDRNFGKNFEKLSSNFGTLPISLQNKTPTRAKLHAIGLFSNLYHDCQQSHIIDEEQAYLQAVESGNVELVEKMLLANDQVDRMKEAHENGGGDGPDTVKKRMSSTPLLDQNKTNEIASEIVEMEEIPVFEPKKTKSIMSNGSSKKAWHSGANPLPVSLTKFSTSSLHYKEQDEHGDIDNGERKKKKKRKFNKNCRDQWGRSAMFLAIIYHNLDMLELLLRYKVDSEECLYHAIDFGYYDIVEVFMRYENDTSQMISGELSFYSPGLTPLQLAAHKNDYVMLRMLHDHGYSITQTSRDRAFAKQSEEILTRTSSGTISVLDRAWNSSNHQLLCYRAICSPAYMIMLFDNGLGSEESSAYPPGIQQERNGVEKKPGNLLVLFLANWDFLEHIFLLYGNLKRKIAKEPAVQSLYLPLADKVEEFACDLLSEVRSSDDLANLLRFDPPGEPRRTSQRNYLTPVQRAIEVRMKRFVAHENSQLAVSSLRLGTLFESEHGWRTLCFRVLLGLAFPVLCLAFSVAPKSKLGSLLCNPIVNMTCHIISDIIFLLLMIIRLILLTEFYPCDCLGMTVYPIDWIIWVWVLARIVNQVKKLRDMPFRELIFDVWSLNDLFTSILFLTVIGLKVHNVTYYTPNLDPHFCPAVNMSQSYQQKVLHSLKLEGEEFERRCTRSKWTADEAFPITVMEAALAVIYFLIHIRAMEMLYTDRTFGPLQLSLDKMLLDTIRFLSIFFVTFIGFAFAMTQLYWAWGKASSFNVNKTEIHECMQDSDEKFCSPVYSTVLPSLLEQYWTLYGYGWGLEPPHATSIQGTPTASKGVTEVVGQIVSMIFHAWAVVVMLNVLVAMLSHSFDRVRNNAELEWKFHRSKTWMKFIRKGVYPRPPPMNLFPSTRDIRSFYNFIRKGCACLKRSGYPVQRETNAEESTRGNHLYKQALKNIIHRYTRRYLLPDFRHDELEQQPPPNLKPSGSMDDLNM